MPLTFACDLLSAGYLQRRKSNTWWIQKQDTFVSFFEVWKLQSPFLVTARKRATRTFLNVSLFVFHWRTKNKVTKIFLVKKILWKAAAPCVIIHTKCFYVKSDGLDLRYGSFKLMKGVQAFLWIAIEKLKSACWTGSPRHKYSRNILSADIRRGNREILHESRLVEGWRLSCQNVAKKWKRTNTSEWIFHNTS